MQRLAALVPRPRLHLIRFHGVLAPNATLRKAVVPVPPTASAPAPAHAGDCAHLPVAKLGRMAYNALTETVASKPMFRTAWNQRRFYLVPAEAFYEPNWESGNAVRWRIEMASHEPFAIGGIWESYGKGETYFESFSMLTINADAHVVMNHFHKLGDEKRMPVIIEPENYLKWLAASMETAAQFFRPLSPDLMTAKPEPLAPRSVKLAKPRAKETADEVKLINDFF